MHSSATSMCKAVTNPGMTVHVRRNTQGTGIYCWNNKIQQLSSVRVEIPSASDRRDIYTNCSANPAKEAIDAVSRFDSGIGVVWLRRFLCSCPGSRPPTRSAVAPTMTGRRVGYACIRPARATGTWFPPPLRPYASAVRLPGGDESASGFAHPWRGQRTLEAASFSSACRA